MNAIRFQQGISVLRHEVAFTTFSLALLALALLTAPAARAQSATVYGSLSNFDVVNNTGNDAHGFEIELEGLQPQDVYYTFSAQRYGSPVITPYATGVRVRWASAYDNNVQQFMQKTLAHAANTPFAGSCYQWGANYDAAGCEHFGVTLSANATKTTYRWLAADAQTPGALAVVDPPVAIPAPTYIVLPPARPAEPPVLEAEIEAPEPAEAPELFGNAQWVKVFKTELPRPVALDELMSDNAIVPQDAAHAEVSWEIIQAEPASNSNGNRRRRQNQGSLNFSTRSVVRRYEIYQFTGAYDPLTHEALCADLTCTTPQAGEVGEFVGAQMAAANVNVPSVTITKSGNGNVASADRLLSCGSKCAAGVNAGTLMTLTASPASGNAFTGWGGACNGSDPTCSVTVNEALNVTATFLPVYSLSIGRSGSGTVTSNPVAIDCGKTCSAKIVQGTTVTLTATPAAGQRFVNWSGACSGSAPTCTLTVTQNASVQAVFSR
ncbi:MAG: InlB B-repeat-containing protein [Blastocatellia bacterium]